MKKLLSTTVFLTVSSFTYAQGGFTGPASKQANAEKSTISVAQAKRMSEDSMVTLTGYIVESLGKEMYLFKATDSSDAIEVEIEAEEWKNITADDKTLLKIVGEVDSEWGSNYIEVEFLRLVQ